MKNNRHSRETEVLNFLENKERLECRPDFRQLINIPRDNWTIAIKHGIYYYRNEEFKDQKGSHLVTHHSQSLGIDIAYYTVKLYT